MARLTNRFLCMFLRTAFENKIKKPFSIVFSLKKTFGKLFFKTISNNN
jgi:hypothetical protein